jgi:hypothetical protein
MNKKLQSYASEFARLGGLSKSPARASASRANGKLGGRPKKVKKAATPAVNPAEKSI